MLIPPEHLDPAYVAEYAKKLKALRDCGLPARLTSPPDRKKKPRVEKGKKQKR